MRYILFLFLTILVAACNQKTALLNSIIEVPLIKKRNAGTDDACCRDQNSYIPDTTLINQFPERTLKVNFHFTYDDEGNNNVPLEKAARKAKSVLHYANLKFGLNCKMNLPLGNDTPVLPMNIKLELTPKPYDKNDEGIYFHNDEELYAFVKGGENENRAKRDVIKKYGVQLDTVLNIFVMPHHPDSIGRKKYRSDITGIALGNAVKLAGWSNTKMPDWEIAKNLMHEVCHITGLSHTWSGKDGCDDTPNNPNCWHQTSNGSVCDSLASNNLMDYNAAKCALTPQQIGRMHKNISYLRSRSRRFLKKDFCDLDEKKNIIISDSIDWRGAKDVAGHIIVQNKGILKMNCRVSMPEYGRIIVMPGGKLILNNNLIHNDCDKIWEGIEVYSRRRKVGQIVMQGKPILEDSRNEDYILKRMRTSSSIFMLENGFIDEML